MRTDLVDLIRGSESFNHGTVMVDEAIDEPSSIGKEILKLETFMPEIDGKLLS